MQRGTIKQFNPETNFGFIAPDHPGADVFFHLREVRLPERPQVGQRVNFKSFGICGQLRAMKMEVEKANV